MIYTKRLFILCLAAAAFFSPSLAVAAQTLDQGADWTDARRKDFYTRDQGSRLMPLRWFASLRQPNGAPFLADSLARYGYIPNEATPGLPIGFSVARDEGGDSVGLTCAACHTRQIEVDGKALRVDGGPAIADLHGFWSDLDAAVDATLTRSAVFDAFAKDVLGADYSADRAAQLRDALSAWFLRFHAITEHGLPKQSWGPGRADAVSMIFNRLAGLDVGPAPSHVLVDNIALADAPVRYPFLWNAPIQDMTQWPGFARNGDDVLALARNLGEVIGVFGVYYPKREGLLIDFLEGASFNFRGLAQLESDIHKLGPPKWPWPVDAALAAKGKEIFDRPEAQGGCGPGCHEIRPGQQRLLNRNTWWTPEQDVGTDSREYRVLVRTAKSGALEGAFIPVLMDAPLKAQDEKIINMLAASVFGSILQYPFDRTKDLAPALLEALKDGRLPLDPQDLGSPAVVLQQALKDAYDAKSAKAPTGGDPCGGGACKYEARVLQGIWATAPYLHNGSVPSLAELLKPAKDRKPAFRIGPAYDRDAVGLAEQQTKFNFTLQTTGCEARDSGASRCGHEFGTTLTPAEKKALLEYLKTL